jgi:hypothetical protein
MPAAGPMTSATFRQSRMDLHLEILRRPVRELRSTDSCSEEDLA